MDVRRGEVYYADLGDDNVGSEQHGTRPVLIIQNNIGNKYSPTVIVACITSKIFKNEIPTHVRCSLPDGSGTLRSENSLILCEQIKTIDKTRLKSKIAALTENEMARVNKALRLSIGLYA